LERPGPDWIPDRFAIHADLTLGTPAGNAERNALASRVAVFAGGLEALAPRAFDLVLANLLRAEALPLLAGIAARTRVGGTAVFSGLLAAEVEGFESALQKAGLAPAGVRRFEDANGECWAALLTRR
jgi:ribosomal protein L11 methylase PrmA